MTATTGQVYAVQGGAIQLLEGWTVSGSIARVLDADAKLFEPMENS